MPTTRRTATRATSSGTTEVIHVPVRKIPGRHRHATTKHRTSRSKERVASASKAAQKRSRIVRRNRNVSDDNSNASSPRGEEYGSDAEDDTSHGSPNNQELPRSPSRSGRSASDTEEEQERRQRARQRHVEHQILVGRSAPLSHVQSRSQARTSDHRARTPSPQPDAEPAPVINCTPYKPEYDPRKQEETLECGYSPISRKVVQSLKGPFKTYVATERAFFTQQQADEYLTPLLDDHLRQGAAGKKNRIARKADGIYYPNILRHVRATASKLRNHVITVARPIVKTQYELVARKPPHAPEDATQRAGRVKDLLTDYKFAALDTDTGIGMFEHPAIHEVISAAFFHSSAPTFNLGADERYVDNFKPYPNALIALAATAVFATLSEWTTGSWVKGKFEGRKYDDAFENLLELLKDITAGREESEEFDKKRADWYTDAWQQTPLVSVVQDATNRDSIVMRNRAALRAARMQAQRAAVDEADGGAGASEENGEGGSGFEYD